MIPRRFLRALVATLLASLLLVVGTTHAASADDPSSDAKAVNTEDGATVFRFAFSIRQVTNGLIDETNTATAEASCVDCRTVALAFQVIFVSGDADTVVPENRATAVNYECSECLTYAKATQIVVDMDGMELTENGKRRLKALEKHLAEIERGAADMSDAELLAESRAAEAELIAIFDEELVPIGTSGPTTTTTSSSTTSAPSSTTTSSTSTTSSTTQPTTTTTAAG